MNNLVIALTLWLGVAGLLGGTAINVSAERCGAPQRLTQDDVQSWLWWPVLLVAAAVADGNNIAYDLCDKLEE